MYNKDLARLSEIRGSMMELLDEAKNLLRREASQDVFNRAKHTWIGNADVALGGGEFVDTHSHTFRKTLGELGVCEECLEVPCTCVDEGPENPNCSECEETPCVCEDEDEGGEEDDDG